jgi:hypothetical protein
MDGMSFSATDILLFVIQYDIGITVIMYGVKTPLKKFCYLLAATVVFIKNVFFTCGVL